MNDDQIIARITYCMGGAALAAIFIVVAMLTNDSEWAAVALLPALTSLVAVGSVLRDLRKRRP